MVKGGKRKGDPRVYEVAGRFLDEGWRTDGSVFTPGGIVWTLSAFDELRRDFVENADESARGFEAKLHDQLAISSDRSKQLMAELLYLHVLVSSVITVPKKVEIVERVLRWMNDPVPLPDDLLPALGLGMVNPGTYFNTGRWAQLRFLIEAGRRWKQQDAGLREKLVDDPWAFKAFLADVPEQGAATQRHALLHLLYPDTFEAIVSDDHIGRIIERFGDLAPLEPGEEPDPDRQLHHIREALTDRYGDSFDFYDARIRGQWQQGIDPWGDLIRWAEKLYASPRFDIEERDYKIAAVEALGEAIEAVGTGHSWRDALRRGIQNPQNNLTQWQVNLDLLDWADQEPELARQTLAALWTENGEPGDRVQAFADVLGRERLRSPGNRVAMASYLLMGLRPTTYPVYRPAPFKDVHRLVGRTASTGPEGERYSEALAFCDELIAEAAARGLQLRDRLDAQALVWALAKTDADSPLLEGWSDREKQEFFSWRKGVVEPEAEAGDDAEDSMTASEQESTVDWLDWAARECHLPLSYVSEIVELLRDKKQLVLYGPPGTGKTFVALALARALCEGDDSRLAFVQFHPSTTYEDFFEGIRPTTDDEGRIHYAVRPGPLVRMAALARTNPAKQFVMVVDELSRANLPKVLGELLFLFEYRDRDVFTLYRPDEAFQLPENLWFIGTMNTVDRSVALIDAAMRRRFHFVPFYPDRSPVTDVLGSICTDSEAWVAELVERVNGELVIDLGGRDHQLGASHFIRAERTPEGLEKVWRYTIEPLIEDQFFGQEDRVERYRWAAVRRRHADVIPGAHPAETAADGAAEDARSESEE